MDQDATQVRPLAGVMAEIARTLESPADLEGRVRHVLSLVGQLVPYDRCAILWRNDGGAEHVVLIPDVGDGPEVRTLLDGLLAFLSGESDSRKPLQSGAHLALPIVGLDQVAGVLLVQRDQAVDFLEHHLQFLSAVTSQLGSYFTLVRLHEQARAMKEEAEHANRLKDEFLAVISHELRTPLNAILGWSRMLTAKQLTPERSSHAMTSIERNASALAQLIEDLLDVSRAIAGNLQVAAESIDVVAAAQSAIETVRPAAAAKRLDLRCAFDAPGAMVCGDAHRLRQAIANLLSNAVKFTPEGGRIDVAVERGESDVLVRVSDTGAGIDPAFLPHVFERFRQGDAKTTRRQSGLGLGLAIVRQLVELHGGSVSAESAGLGHGATFTIALPILPVAGVGASPPALGPRPALESLDGIRVLLIEDHADSRDMMSTLLERAGAEVKTAGSVREAMTTQRGFEPHVLVTDIGLPDEDGYALVRRLRRQEAKRGGFLPAIAVTGFARDRDRDRAIAAGFQAHLAKPVDPAELTRVIVSVAQRG